MANNKYLFTSESVSEGHPESNKMRINKRFKIDGGENRYKK